MTLCPILDFANHAPQDTHILPVLPPVSQPVVPNSGPGKRSKSLGGDYAFVSNCENTIPQDTELFLRYGAHANRKLFVEYGFVNMWNKGEVEDGIFQGEVEVDDVVEVYFKNKGGLGDQMKAILEQEGYWGYVVGNSSFGCILIRPQRLDLAFYSSAGTPVLSSGYCIAIVALYGT